MVKHTQTICRQQQVICLSVFDHFVGLVLKGLRKTYEIFQESFFQDKNFHKKIQEAALS